MIPKIFFQTSKKPPTKYLSYLIKNKLEEDWKYLHFDDLQMIEFIKMHPIDGIENITDKLNKLSGPHIADIFRYYYIYLCGGFFMDSDAMIYENIEKIIDDFDFVTVNSSCHPGSIFQGIIGANSGNLIIKKALFKACETDLESIKSDYHIFCKQLFDIVQSSEKYKIRLLNEHRPNSKGDLITDEENNIYFIHYWKRKNIKFNLQEYISFVKYHLYKKIQKLL
jgi:hypothetical protein